MVYHFLFTDALGAVLYPQYEEYLSAPEYPEWMVGYIVHIIDEQEDSFCITLGGLFFI